MKERILEYLRQEHREPELRTMRGIAAILNVDERELLSVMAGLERDGLILGRRRDGKELWFRTDTAPLGR
jgi:hypothetical protein